MSDANSRILSRIAAASTVTPTVVSPSASISGKPTWTKLDVSTLPDALQAQDKELREVMALLKTLKETFRLALEAIIEPDDHETVIVNWNFGDLSLAIVPKEAKAKGKSAPMSLASLIATQANGRPPIP